MAETIDKRVQERRSRRMVWYMAIIVAIVGGVLAVLFGLVIPATNDEEATPVAVVLREVTAAPESYYGEDVAVTGVVRAMLHERVFGIEDDLLVVGDIPDGLTAGDAVNVEGTVRPFAHLEENDVVDADFTDERWDAWRDKPVLIASSVSNGFSAGLGGQATSMRTSVAARTMLVSGQRWLA